MFHYRSIYYAFFFTLNTTPNTLDAAKKNPVVSCDLQLCDKHVTIERFMVTARALMLGLSVLMRESVLDRLETMHQMCPRYHCVAVDFCFIIVIRVLKKCDASYLW